MADNTSYTIYLKTLGGGEGKSQNPTTPTMKPANPTAPQSLANSTFMAGFKSFTTGIKKFSLVGASAVKSFLPVAITLGIAKTIDSAVTFLLPFYTTATGDYAFQNSYSNFKRSISNIFNPIQTFTNYQKVQLEINVANQNAREQRLLLADSTINYNFGRGINV